MITLNVTEETAQALYTLMLFGVPANGDMWDRLYNLYDALDESRRFSSDIPSENATMAGFQEIMTWKVPFPIKENNVISEKGIFGDA